MAWVLYVSLMSEWQYKISLWKLFCSQGCPGEWSPVGSDMSDCFFCSPASGMWLVTYLAVEERRWILHRWFVALSLNSLRNPGWEGLLRRCSLREAVLIGQPPFCKGRRKRQGLVLTTVVLRKQIGKGEAYVSQTGCFWKWLLLLGSTILFCDLGICSHSGQQFASPDLWCSVFIHLCLRHHTFLFLPPNKKCP